MKVRVFILLFVIGLAPVSARADVFDSVTDIYDLVAQGFEEAWPDEFVREGWQVDVGAGTAVLPEYVGSDRYRLAVLPLVRVSYNGFFTLRNTKLKVNLLRYGDFRSGVVAKYAFGRNESGDPVLAGLGNIGDTVELGAFLRYDHGHFAAKVEMRESVSAAQGGTLYLNVSQGLYRSERLRVGLLGSLVLASGEKMQTNYGITEAQANASPMDLSPFEADGGLYQTNFFVGGEYALTEHWRVAGLLSYTRLLGDAADSPIVADFGDPNQFTAGMGLLYRF